MTDELFTIQQELEKRYPNKKVYRQDADTVIVKGNKQYLVASFSTEHGILFQICDYRPFSVEYFEFAKDAYRDFDDRERKRTLKVVKK